MTLLSSRPAAGWQADTARLGDWEVAPGFRLDVVARSFRFPTAIAFVPAPAADPASPRFFVTELHGAIRVVAGDGTVSTFAGGFIPFVPVQAMPFNRGENGMAGICLDAATGSVFVTHVFQDGTGTLRNGMSRFRSPPRTFAIRPASRQSLDSVFAGARSAESHQIGPCRVDGDAVFVAVGDGMQGRVSQEPRSTLGKILRMTVDGRPYPGNPLAGPDATPYVWAMGFRNVFSLALADGRVFGAENGRDIDRFLEIERARNYLWAGHDQTIAMNAAFVFAPAVSPVQMDFAPPDYAPFPPQYRARFYLALAGPAGETGPGRAGERSIVAIDFDFETNRLRSPPTPVVRYRGNGAGGIVAAALGPDGLYFAPLFPGPGGGSPILRLTWDPEHEHASVIGNDTRPATLLADHGCLGCHFLRDRGGAFGPSLSDPPLAARLVERLSSPEYLDRLDRADALVVEPFPSWAATRDSIRSAPPEDRPRLWIRARLLEPRFDDPGNAMPNPGLTATEADRLAQYLLAESAATAPSLGRRWGLPPARYRYVLLAFLLGCLVPAWGAAARVWRAVRRRPGS